MNDAARALAQALTGQEVALSSTVGPHAAAVLTALAGTGWDPARITDVVAARRASGQPWPVPVPCQGRGAVGAAALAALVREAVDLLGVDRPEALTAAHRTLTADERRLLADVPPHHGQVG